MNHAPYRSSHLPSSLPVGGSGGGSGGSPQRSGDGVVRRPGDVPLLGELGYAIERACLVRRYSRRTVNTYTWWERRFVMFCERQHPANLGAPEVSAFITNLAVEHRVSASTQNQAL